MSTTPNRKEPGSYRYVDGLCVDAHGAIGHNPLASVAFATPERKRIELKFGAAPGNFVYLETVDAECADLSGVEDFARDVLHVGSTGLWIQELDLRGAVGLKRFGRVDTPRARLEGAALPADFASGSHIAASADRLTLLGSVPALQACGDIKHRKGEWPDRIVEPNNVYCSTP